MKKSIFLIVSLIFYNFVLANGASFAPGAYGITVVPYDIKGVQLIKEIVHIYYDKTVCRFYLKNLGKKDIIFQMGFPFNMTMDQSGTYEESKRNFEKIINEIDFEVKSNGENVTVNKRINDIDETNALKREQEKIQKIISNNYPLKKTIHKIEIKKENQDNETPLYDVVFLWQQSIEAQQTVEVVCTYKTPSDLSMNKEGVSRTIRYIRNTAKFWEDKIYEAHFYIHLTGLEKTFDQRWLKEPVDKLDKIRIFNISPQKYFFNSKENTIEWHEYYVKEMDDIEFTYSFGGGEGLEIDRNGPINAEIYWNTQYFLSLCDFVPVKQMLNEKIMDYKEAAHFLLLLNWCMGEGARKLDPWEQRIFFRLLRNYYYARHGKVFEDNILNEFYKKVFNPGNNLLSTHKDFRPKEIVKGDLSEIEKNNVMMIQEYEDKMLYSFDDVKEPSEITNGKNVSIVTGNNKNSVGFDFSRGEVNSQHNFRSDLYFDAWIHKDTEINKSQCNVSINGYFLDMGINNIKDINKIPDVPENRNMMPIIEGHLYAFKSTENCFGIIKINKIKCLEGEGLSSKASVSFDWEYQANGSKVLK